VATAITHLWRLLRWGRTLGRHGVLRPFEAIADLPAPLRLVARLARFGTRAPLEPQYAEALEKLGPAAIKLGQALATRPDLIGEAATRDLARLQDKLPPVPFAQIKAVLDDAFGAVATAYASIDETPVGAASIAQVHKATTPDGRTVAVKVLRPGIEQTFATAIETYAWAAAQVEALGGEAARLRPRRVIESFRTWVARELDLRLEAANASELAEVMAAEPLYRVPAVDWDRTSRRVLTLEWIDGIKLTDPGALWAQAGLDRRTLARVAVQGFLHQAIVAGAFHADHHQGNLFVQVDEQFPHGRLVAVDFGIMGRLDPLARRYLAEILYGLQTRNYRRVAEIHFEAGYVPPHHSVEEFAAALRAVGEPIFGRPIKEVSPGRLLDQLFVVTRIFEMETQPHLLLLQKTMVMVEGVASTLDPDANMWELAAPFVTRWIRDELGPEAIAARTIHTGLRTLALVPDLIRRMDHLVPRPGAAPPQAPLPPLAARRPLTWLWLALALGLGIAIGALIS
jgi:ubiquinone biosynthesis protein